MKNHLTNLNFMSKKTKKNINEQGLHIYRGLSKQAGGRVSFPSEYFGKDSGRYFSNTEFTDMSKTTSTDARVGLPLKATFTGGNKLTKNFFSSKSFDNFFNYSKKNLKETKITGKAKINLKKMIGENFENKLTNINNMKGGSKLLNKHIKNSLN